MAVFIPRGGSFTWGRSGLTRWGSPVERRHELGTRAPISSLFPGPSHSHWLDQGLLPNERADFCSFSTQFGGDFKFDLEVRSGTSGSLVHLYRVIAVVNNVEYLSVSHSTSQGWTFVSPFQITLLGVSPHAVIKFSIVNRSTVRHYQMGMLVRPVFSNRVGPLIPHALQPIASRTRENIQGESISQVNVDLGQTPPIRVISPAVPHDVFEVP